MQPTGHSPTVEMGPSLTDLFPSFCFMLLGQTNALKMSFTLMSYADLTEGAVDQ